MMMLQLIKIIEKDSLIQTENSCTQNTHDTCIRQRIDRHIIET